MGQKGSIKYGWNIELILDHDGIERLDFQPIECYWGRWMGVTVPRRIGLSPKKLKKFIQFSFR